MRGRDWVWLPLVRGGGCVGIPLSEEVDCVVLDKCLSLICKVDFVGFVPSL